MFIKICGITRREDALAAVECGASAVGFVFWSESPRYIDPERAREIVEALPARVTTVGVFVNQSAADVNAIADRVRLGAVQLHGDEDPGFAAEMTRPVIKAINAIEAVRLDAAAVNGWPEQVTLLVDADDAVLHGGTGKVANWPAAAGLARKRRVLLAGGLTPENVGQAIAEVQPFGLDVSSGVESAPGVKDHQRLKALFEAATGRR